MADLPSSSSDPLAAHPLEASERLQLLDVLRGFALGGVFVSNVFVWFSGLVFFPKEKSEALMASPVEAAVSLGFTFFISGKFVTLFSFLFGLGFAVQMLRAEARGASVVPIYLRRLGAMLLIGLSHLALLWYGDILTMYSLVGFLLLLFRKRSDRALLVTAGVLLVLMPVGVPLLQKYVPLLFGSREAAEAAARAVAEKGKALRAEVLAIFTHGSWADAVGANVRFYASRFLGLHLVANVSVLLSRFLLGLVAGRRKLFHDVEGNRKLFLRLLGWGLALGVLGNGGAVAVRLLRLHGLVEEKATWMLFMPWVNELGYLGFAAAYLAGISLLFQRPAWRRVLMVLAPAGQMALTNYLSQTVLALLLFYGYGLGLIGTTSRLVSLALPLGLFCVQVAVSHVWMARFRFGPAEWVWRSLTYGRPQPMRRSHAAPEAPAPA
jgi:uncharacterized protein